VYLPLGSLSPRLRSRGDAVYFRSHLFGTSTGDEFQCFLVYLTLGSVPLGLGPIEMLCISGLIFFWDLIWVWGWGIRSGFHFSFLNFSQFWDVPKLVIINKEDLAQFGHRPYMKVEHLNNHFTFCLLNEISAVVKIW